ncbi:latrophilin Cirl-like isoform X6 [Dermacentor variabilis]|uniref:latrophilin Cirl-like isoform X6 n=1 Tax=Dermacentor variabilis TaxID=34621 RepID=UPI003F5B4B4B
MRACMHVIALRQWSRPSSANAVELISWDDGDSRKKRSTTCAGCQALQTVPGQGLPWTSALTRHGHAPFSIGRPHFVSTGAMWLRIRTAALLLLLACTFRPVAARRGGGGSLYKTAYACEGSQLGFSCPEGQLIALIRANYGRFSISICNEHGTLDWSVDCKSNRSYNVIRDSCGMRRKCSLPASTDVFGDPCPGTFKYLEAHYQCIAESPTTPSSTTPSTTSTTTTTSRPLIIIPATQFQRPPPPLLPTPASQPPPSTREPSGDAGRRPSSTPPPSVPETASEAHGVAGPSARPEMPGAHGLTTTSSDWSTTTVFTLHRAPPSPRTQPTDGYDIWGGSWGSTTERSFDSPHLGRGRFQDPDRASGVPSHLHRGFCPPMQSRSSFWNWTRAGDTAVQRCPGGAIGHARWRCLPGSPPYWEHDTPNLSACYSAWMENLKSRAEDDDSVVSLAVELEVITRTKTLLGGDIAQTAGVIQRLLARMTRRLDDFPDERRRFQVVKELLQSTVEISSNLLEDYQRDSWLELPPRERRHVAGALLRALDNSTWLLADTKNAAFRFSRAHGNVLVSVRLVETWAASEIRFPVHEDVHGTVWMRMQDTLVFPPQALLGSARNGVVKLVFMAYRNIEDFLGPDVASSTAAGVEATTERIVNSRVIAASVNSRHLVKLHQPVLITFQHREVENVTNPRCVFWSFDDEEWLTEGCWLKETNETHSVCACNHLTNFALAMDRRPPEFTSTEQKMQLFVYASFAACMILLIAAGFTLQAFRSLKGERVTIHKNACLCLLLTEALLASGLGGHPQRVVCGVLAGFLHYFWLAAYFWALLEGFQLYTVLLDVLGTEPPSSRLRWYYLLAYGAPAVIVCVSAGISPSSYGAPLGPSLQSRRACWIDMEGHQLWSFVGPAAFCAALCLIFLAMVFCKAHRHVDLHATLKSKEQERIANTRSLSAHSLLVLASLCLVSSFAQLHVSRGSLVHTSLFSVLNILLGVAVLVFYCLSNDKSTPQSWSSLKEHESSEVTQDARNHATQGLPSIATVTSNYPCEEHPLRSWICNAWPPPAAQPAPPPDCLPYTAAQWPPNHQHPRSSASDDGSWKPPDPYSRNDHVYETIDEDAAQHHSQSGDGWRTQPHQAGGRHGPKQGGSYRSLGRAAMLNSVVAPAPDRTILGSLTAALASSPRARHLPIIGDSCLRQQVAYSGIKSPSDSERSSSSLMDEERTESSATLALEDRGRGVWSSETSQHGSDVFVREGVEHF